MIRMEKSAVYRPTLVMAYVDSAHAARCGRYFRRHGWEVRLVASAAEVRRLLMTCNPSAIVLDTELPDESGWLICAKVMHEDPGHKVILLAPDSSRENLQNAAKVNAAGLVTRQDRLEALAEMIRGEQLAEAV